MNKMDDAVELLLDTYSQFRKTPTDYWQGRKDGSRLMYALLGDESLGDLKHLTETSPRHQGTYKEVVNELLADAVYNVAAILYEMENLDRVDIRTKLNLMEFLRDYRAYSSEGMFPVIDDHC